MSTLFGIKVSFAAELASLDMVERDYLPNVARVAPLLRAGVEELARKYPVIGDVRGVGLMIGIEFVRDRSTREPHTRLVHDLVQRAFRNGLLLLSAGQSSLRLAPPLVIDENDVKRALGIIDRTLGELLQSS